PCILAMRMAFRGIKKLDASFKFISDGYSAYPLASQQFALKEDNPLSFDVTQVIGLTEGFSSLFLDFEPEVTD
ncbi:transposase, partial [bacterium AH-315-G05]|nr:transposase [bacterium AH-315-G05]